jgi:hypothetical protein
MLTVGDFQHLLRVTTLDTLMTGLKKGGSVCGGSFLNKRLLGSVIFGTNLPITNRLNE